MSAAPRVWTAPIAITVVSTVAIVVGLLADGLADAVAFVGTGMPIAIVAWYVMRRSH